MLATGDCLLITLCGASASAFLAYIAGRLHGEKIQNEQTQILLGGESISARYHELLMQVGHKYPGETRHQTALRYLRQAETQTHCGVEAAKDVHTNDR